MDLIKEDQIGKAAADQFAVILKTHPLAIELRNTTVRIGETTVEVSADIKLRME